MHGSVNNFVRDALSCEMVTGRRVLEVGSMDVNGSVRPFVESLHPLCYVGVDMRAGRGVDVVGDCVVLPTFVGYSMWDLVLCLEMLEHAQDWRRCMVGIVLALALGGFLLLTTRGPGFPYHGFPCDYWRFTVRDFELIVSALGLNLVVAVDDPQASGVFVLARKSESAHRVVAGCLDDVVVSGVT